MRKNLKFILLIIAIFLTFFMLGRELIKTRVQLKKTQDEIAQEKKEKTVIQDELSLTRTQLQEAEDELKQAHYDLDYINKKYSSLKNDNSLLRQLKEELEQKIASLNKDKQIIEARLHSLTELKNAIRLVKVEIRERQIKEQKELDAQRLAYGNRGFLIKEGKSVCQQKIRIEVRPANLTLNK